MASELGYPDSVMKSGGNHGKVEEKDARKEWGNPGRADSNGAPISAQSGMAPLQSSQTPHGTVEKQEARKEYATKGV